MMIRIYNLGAGAEFHRSEFIGDVQGGEMLYLPYHEIVNVPPSRILGGVFQSLSRNLNTKSVRQVRALDPLTRETALTLLLPYI